MTDLTVSVIIVSRGRPAALIRCLTALSQLRYAPFEIIVVSDPAGGEALQSWPKAQHVRHIAFDQANISAARNLGIAAATGEVLAFIDDDAVPEPGWLRHLVMPFRQTDVVAAGGYVIGRNGMSWQWRAQSVDVLGQARPLDINGTQPVVLTPPAGRAIKTEGTNMALRRSAITGLGGFDERYHYFLDETDVNLGLARLGCATAIAPLAVVHHGYAENAMRRANRAPRDLTEMGASWAVFLAKHAPPDQVTMRWAEIQAEQRRRLLRFMVSGLLEPRDVRRLMTSLRKGYRIGQDRPVFEPIPSPLPDTGFQPFPSDPARAMTTLSGRIWSRHRLRQRAKEAAQSGKNVNLYLFSPTALFHTKAFKKGGYWEQKGGLFGKSARTDRLLRLWRFGKRVEREERLWSSYR